MRRLRFNNFDRGSLQPSDSEKFYEAYVQLGKIIDDEDFAFKKQLPPGTILFVDNFRVMHGRTAFDGKRTVSGCYLRSAFYKFFEILKIIIIFFEVVTIGFLVLGEKTCYRHSSSNFENKIICITGVITLRK